MALSVPNFEVSDKESTRDTRAVHSNYNSSFLYFCLTISIFQLPFFSCRFLTETSKSASQMKKEIVKINKKVDLV